MCGTVIFMIIIKLKMKHKCSMPSKMLRHPKWHPFTKLLFNCLLTMSVFS